MRRGFTVMNAIGNGCGNSRNADRHGDPDDDRDMLHGNVLLAATEACVIAPQPYARILGTPHFSDPHGGPFRATRTNATAANMHWPCAFESD